MKRLFGLGLALMMSVAAFAKEIPLKVMETEFGFEVSNLDEKGKRICKGFLNFSEKDDVFVVLKTNKDNFSIDNFAHEIVYGNLAKTLVLTGGKFTTATKDKKINLYGPVANFDSLLVVCSTGNIAQCSAYSDGKNLQLSFSDVSKDEGKEIAKLIKKYTDEKEKIEAEKRAEEERLAAEKKAEEERLARMAMIKDVLKVTPEIINQWFSNKNFYKNNDWVYGLNGDGNITICAYLGKPVENLVVPGKIDGLDVDVIGSLQSIENIKFKTITIPKTVVRIAEGACVDLGLEKIIWEKDSKIKDIGNNAFRYKICNY